jgi:DNA-binding transcriptional regulator YiaG
MVAMPNIATLLKAEISRVARKEVRAEIETLKKASAQHRSAIAQLRRQVTDLEKELKAAQRRGSAKSREASSANADIARRFSASRLAAHRARTGVSAAAYGKLVGMSGATIYLWEQGKARPNPEQIRKLAAVRSLGLRAIQERLASD